MKRVLRDCDLLVGVFWTRIGTPTGDYPSGTVEEIEEHLKSDKPAMLYFSAVPVVPQSLDLKQYELLSKFKESCKSRGILETYATLTEFRSKSTTNCRSSLTKNRLLRMGNRRSRSGSSNLVRQGCYLFPAKPRPSCLRLPMTRAGRL